MTKNQKEEYKQFLIDKSKGKYLTHDAIRFICEANNYDAEKIGNYFLELSGKFNADNNKGLA